VIVHEPGSVGRGAENTAVPGVQSVLEKALYVPVRMLFDAVGQLEMVYMYDPSALFASLYVVKQVLTWKPLCSSGMPEQVGLLASKLFA